MTDQQYTPDTDQVRMDYIQASEGDRVDPEEAGPQFDRWLATVEAAAEQRGAIKALRDAAGAIEKNQIMTQVGHLQPCNSCMVIHMDFLDYRADQMEGDDE